jgi:two-component system phosphate regulon sensor histidine kinase PhoR
MRRDFVANASHELRSPLTVISGYLDSMAEDSDIPDVWARPAREMRLQARRMDHIVAELLELSRLESAGPAARDQLVDVGGLLAAAKKTFYKPGMTAIFELDIESTARLRGSDAEIESLITNLVSNAVRHTPADGRITLTWCPDAGGAELRIADTGEGIDSEHLPRLTERFFRVDKGRARTDGGVGLGLAIVKHVLSRHDAALEVDSEPGEGSTFRCRFPPGRIEINPPIPIVGETVHS